LRDQPRDVAKRAKSVRDRLQRPALLPGQLDGSVIDPRDDLTAATDDRRTSIDDEVVPGAFEQLDDRSSDRFGTSLGIVVTTVLDDGSEPIVVERQHDLVGPDEEQRPSGVDPHGDASPQEWLVDRPDRARVVAELTRRADLPLGSVLRLVMVGVRHQRSLR
jgi:hypothetical protein